jgi:hypothetical protein
MNFAAQHDRSGSYLIEKELLATGISVPVAGFFTG